MQPGQAAPARLGFVTRYDDLINRTRAGETILIDGATGSESIRRGAPPLPNGWSGGAVLSHPDAVREIHADYIDLGAAVVVANTFATGQNVLRDAGVPETFEEVNRRAVELALDARAASDDVVVAAGVSNWSFSGDRPGLGTLCDDTARQAAMFAAAGAELLILEMMVDIPRMTATLDGVATVDLPVWVGFSLGPEEGCEPDEIGDPVELQEGDLLRDAVAVAREYPNVDAMVIMHSDVRVTERGIEALRAEYDGPIGAWAHAAGAEGDEIVFDDVITPEEYVAYVPAWRAAGATLIGGCCGIGPEHIRAIVATGALD